MGAPLFISKKLSTKIRKRQKGVTRYTATVGVGDGGGNCSTVASVARTHLSEVNYNSFHFCGEWRKKCIFAFPKVAFGE